jgi:hypothetical protein
LLSKLALHLPVYSDSAAACVATAATAFILPRRMQALGEELLSTIVATDDDGDGESAP